MGRGNALPASWERGAYRVDLSIAGKVIASGTFTVTSSAHLSKIQLHHNQRDPQGQPGVLITFQLETWGRLGQETHVVAFVQFPDGRQLKDLDGQYADSRGFVASHLAVHPAYESAIWKNAQIFLPYAQMHLAKGTHDLRVQLVVYEPKTGAAFTRSLWSTMSVTSD